MSKRAMEATQPAGQGPQLRSKGPASRGLRPQKRPAAKPINLQRPSLNQKHLGWWRPLASMAPATFAVIAPLYGAGRSSNTKQLLLL